MPNELLKDGDSNFQKPTKRKFWKFKIIITLITVGFFFVIIRLFFIQIIDTDKYKEKVKRHHLDQDSIRANRGRIYDRNGNLLASNIKSISIAINPSILRDSADSANLFNILDIYTDLDTQTIVQKLNMKDRAFLWVKRGLIQKQIPGFDTVKCRGLLKVEEPKRFYLYGKLCSQLIGFTDVDNNGLEGIEKSYDSILRGKNGFILRNRSSFGELFPSTTLPPVNAVDGKTIELTIDIDLQRIVEAEIEKGVKQYQASAGIVLAIEPSSGEILALASYPSFDPDISSERVSERTRNRAITDIFEPGSTFKLIPLSALLDLKLKSPDDYFDGHKGLLDYGQYQIRDEHPLGLVPLSEAVKFSSNIIFSIIATLVPESKLYEYAKNFGFGSTLGIDLQGEASGKLRKFEEMDLTAWRFFGFGYGLSATCIQIASAYSVIANNGYLMKPHIVKRIFNENGKIEREFKPDTIRKVISPETAKMVTDLLLGVVNDGTGKEAKIYGLNIAGKTGTSQQYATSKYSKEHYNATFVGFFPAENPKVILLVLLDRPLKAIYGGATSAPIFSNIVRRLIAVKNLKLNVWDSIFNPFTSIKIPNLIGKTFFEAQNIAEALNLKIETDDETENTFIFSQEPLPSTKVAPQTVIKVKLKNKNAYFQTNDDLVSLKKIDLRGLSIRKALSILHSKGIKAKIIGKGKVVSQFWYLNNKQLECELKCAITR